MYFSRLSPLHQRRVSVKSFPGLDVRPGAAAGCASAMVNGSTDAFPALEPRKQRGLVAQLTHPNGLTVKDALCWVDGGRLYMNGADCGLTLTDSPKQLVSMGAYLVIFPDKQYINTCDLTDHGFLEKTAATTGTVLFQLSDSAGVVYEGCTVAVSAPAEAAAGSLWLDVSGPEAILCRRGQEGWTPVEDVCVKLSAAGIGDGFSAGDGVKLSGCTAAALDGFHVLAAAESDALVFPGTLAGTVSQEGSITVRRTVPDMDFVVECGNRLWGCKYGLTGGESVNAIYASKLGDFTNWYCYAGLSTDSYAADRGSDGAFTGAAVYLDSPIFFKEDCMERVYPARSGAHQIVTLRCPGVASGSAGSPAVADGVLYYHAPGGIYGFDGSLPVPVSAPLGEAQMSEAVAGSWRGRYVVSLLQGGSRHLYVYDSRRKLWSREDALEVLAFASREDELYALTAAGDVWSMHGAAGTAEEAVSWQFDSGEQGLTAPENTYLQHLRLHLRLAPGAVCRAAVSYDGGATWLPQGTLTAAAGRDGTLHIRPRRSRTLRVRLTGQGSVTLYAVTALCGKGSDEG